MYGLNVFIQKDLSVKVSIPNETEVMIGHPSSSQKILPQFDWRARGIMTPVKHQMNLGSCGVFAAVAVFESLIKKETGKTVDLSEQQIINNSPDFAPSGISSLMCAAMTASIRTMPSTCWNVL